MNGEPVEAVVEHEELLLDFLRDRLGLKGAKRSCEVQVCGTCTVLVDGLPVSACCMLACEAEGRDVLTIEGFARQDHVGGPYTVGPALHELTLVVGSNAVSLRDAGAEVLRMPAGSNPSYLSAARLDVLLDLLTPEDLQRSGWLRLRLRAR